MEPEIHRVRVAELESFAARSLDQTEQGGLLPITPWRAAAQSRNPEASPEDVAMVVAYDGTRIVGYLGSFAGRVMLLDGPIKVQFLSTFLVHPSMQGKGVGRRLLESMLSANADFVLSGASPSASRLYDRMELPRLADQRLLDCRLNRLHPGRVRRALVRTVPLGRHLDRALRPVLDVADSVAWWLLRIAVQGSALAPKLPKAVCVREVDHPSAAALDLRRGEIRPPCFLRDGNIIEWMLRMPWVVRANCDNEWLQEAYRFSATREEFGYTAHEIHRDGECLGFLVLSHSRNEGVWTTKLLDHACGGLDTMSIVGIALAEGIARRSAVVALPERLLGSRLPMLLRLLGRWRSRRSWCRPVSPERGDALKDIEVGVADGDLAFF